MIIKFRSNIREIPDPLQWTKSDLAMRTRGSPSDPLVVTEKEFNFRVNSAHVSQVLAFLFPTNMLLVCNDQSFERKSLKIRRSIDLITILNSNEDRRRLRIRKSSSGIVGAIQEKHYQGAHKLERLIARKLMGKELLSTLKSFAPINASYAKERLTAVYRDNRNRDIKCAIERVVPIDIARRKIESTIYVDLECESEDEAAIFNFVSASFSALDLHPLLRPLKLEDSKHRVAAIKQNDGLGIHIDHVLDVERHFDEVMELAFPTKNPIGSPAPSDDRAFKKSWSVTPAVT